jgi:Tfp pilus assembly protein PilF
MIWNAILLTATLAAPQDEGATAKSTAAVPAESSIDAGILAFKKRNFARAEDEFERAVDANPQSAAAHFYLGYTIYKRVEPMRPFHPDKQKAADEFKKAFELDPSFTPDWGRASSKSKATAKSLD